MRIIILTAGLAAFGLAQGPDRIWDAPVVAFDRFSCVTDVFDFDGDGDQDLGGAWYSQAPMNPPTYRTWEQTGGGGFTPRWTLPLTGTALPITCTGDWNADGRDDVLLAQGAQLSLFISSGIAGASPFAVTTAPDGAMSLLVLDVDRNGFEDVVVAGATTIRVLYMGLGGAPVTWSS